jgi:DNA-binding NarL/FixJ family response regulator
MKPIAAILVVEDNPDIRDWLVECAVGAFARAVVSTAKNFQEARHAIEHRGGVAFDLALIDIGLPDGDGIDLIARLAKSAPECLSVVTTIYDDDVHLFRAIQAGAGGYLLKYHETERLVELLKRIHDGEPPLSPSVARRILGTLQARPTISVSDEQACLTSRENEVLTLLGRGFQLNQVAVHLAITPNTAASHVKSIYRKLNITNRAGAAVAAVNYGLIER